MKSGKRPVIFSPDRHVDAAAFWKSEFEKSEKEKMQFKSRIFVLEHEKGIISNTAIHVADQEAASVKRKRKASAPNARAKKLKIEKTSAEEREQNIIIERLKFKITTEGCVFCKIPRVF